jgi:hypothetical protein
MSVLKQHLEFHTIDMQSGWRAPPGYPPDIEQKILAGSLDETARSGARTRLLRFRAGASTTTRFVHDYWEEVYLLAGDLIVGGGADGLAPQEFGPNTYACRPPGVYHGPFSSKLGCILFEVHYYA